MKTKVLLFTSIVALMLSGCGGPAEWKEFSSSAGGFAVSFPGQPQEETQSVPTAAGDIEMHLFTLDQGNQGYVVGYFDLPESLLGLTDAATLLQGAMEGAFGNVGGSIESQRDVTLNGFTGLEAGGSFSYEGENGTMKARAYLVNERVFQVYAAGRTDTSGSADIDRFLDSFKLTSD
ncbi:MAG TPA: hypothetical protein VJG32_06980 [Anaerolineae bacterium]|nr:hypothetical protein [Anaerolineae bacterium]